MKKMKWLYVLLATFLLTSCGTLMQPYQMDSKMKDIELGMTENTEGYYLLSFKDGKLVEWFKEKYPVHNHQH